MLKKSPGAFTVSCRQRQDCRTSRPSPERRCDRLDSNGRDRGDPDQADGRKRLSGNLPRKGVRQPRRIDRLVPQAHGLIGSRMASSATTSPPGTAPLRSASQTSRRESSVKYLKTMVPKPKIFSLLKVLTKQGRPFPPVEVPAQQFQVLTGSPAIGDAACGICRFGVERPCAMRHPTYIRRGAETDHLHAPWMAKN